VPQLDMDPADLVGTRWQVVTMNGQPPLAGTTLTIVFDSATELSGHAGCRDYRGTYQAEGDDLSLRFLEMTSLECADQARLLQEGEFTTRLSEATRWRLDGDTLEIHGAGGAVMVLERER
jgi:heat shock protein HslJ